MLVSVLLLCAPAFAPAPLQGGASCPYTRLQAGGIGPGDHFGRIDVDGDTLLAGAWDKDVGGTYGAGLAYVFLRDDNGTPDDRRDDTWVETHTFRAGQGSVSFGSGGTLQGKTAVVGAIREPLNDEPGSAYVFGLDDGETPLDPSDDEWLLVDELTSLCETRDWFGAGIDLQGDTLIVTARFDDTTVENAGAFYHYERDDAGTLGNPFDDVWTIVSKVTASNPNQHASFGLTMALEGDLLLIGAPQATGGGAVYTFQRDRAGTPDPLDDTWVELGQVSTTDPTTSTFGNGLGLSGDHMVVGARLAEIAGDQRGKVYAYVRDHAGTPADPLDDSWVALGSFTSSDGGVRDYFGLGLDLDGDVLAVGAPRHDGLGQDVGATYLFERDDLGTSDPYDDVYVEVEKIVPADSLQYMNFGGSRFYGDELWVGSGGQDGGAVYVFDRGWPCPGTLGTRVGWGINPLRLTGAAVPIVGGTFEARVDTTGHVGVQFTLIEVYDRPLVGGVIINAGQVLLDTVNGARLGGRSVISSPTGLDVFLFPIPADPALVGEQAFLQAATFGGATGLELCNALDTTLGAP